MYLCMCSNRVCKNPVLPPLKPAKKPNRSSSVPGEQTSSTSSSKLKRIVERKSHRAASSSDVKPSASKPDVDTNPPNKEPDSTPGRRRGRRVFGARKFASASSLNRLKHRTDRGPSSDAAWKRRGDPWRKRRSLLAPDRAPSGTLSPRRVPSSSSLASLSDTDGSKYSSSSQSRSLLRVHCRFLYVFV